MGHAIPVATATVRCIWFVCFVLFLVFLFLVVVVVVFYGNGTLTAASYYNSMEHVING